MKKINLFIVALVAMLGFSFSVQAADSVKLKCDAKELKPGDSTNCQVSFTSDTALNEFKVVLTTSKHLKVSKPTANSTAKWVEDTANTSAANGTYAFKQSGSSTTKSGQVFSFTLKLSESAKDLSADENCGNLCISAAYFNNVLAFDHDENEGTCYAPTVVEEDKPSNPNTGAFMNYALIGGALLIAGAAVVVARKSAKFFRI